MNIITHCPNCKKKWSRDYGCRKCNLVYWYDANVGIVSWIGKEFGKDFLYWYPVFDTPSFEIEKCTFYSHEANKNTYIIPIPPFDATLDLIKLYLTFS